MKLQHLAIIFVIIILPISMVISSYIQTQIDTIYIQTTYNSKLQTATYDAIKAFQLNTLNNKYSTLSDSKIRDIEASISTFYNSLGTELGASGYNKESLQQFIPAILYTMYDGYYIYGKYYNETYKEFQYGLKPYMHYSCRYKVGNGKSYDFVVNYTLDNSITIYGTVNGEYFTKSGTLINPSLVKEEKKGTDKLANDIVSLKYNDIEITPEVLKEQLVILTGSGLPDSTSNIPYEYTVYNNQKIYYDGESYFRYVNNQKQIIDFTSSNNSAEKEFLEKWTYNGSLHCNSAIEYYEKAKVFSEWVNTNLGSITQENAVDAEGKEIKDFAMNTGKGEIFKLESNNDPMLDSSTFNQNRISVIRKSIESNLSSAISNYSSSAAYDFEMPKFNEEDWDKIVNNIAIASFMQGIPIGAKYYNNYCIISNNKNKEVVSKDSIYVITNDGEAHVAGSMDVLDEGKEVSEAYKNISFEMQEVIDSNGTSNYYYPKDNLRCYKCMVNVSKTYDIDDIISGEIKTYNSIKGEYEKNQNATNNLNTKGLRKTYLTALARERQNLYKTNDYFGI